METGPKIEGVGIAVHGDLQAAIDEGGAIYRRKFGRAPTHVALPPGTDPATVNLYGGALNLARPAGARTVIVGRAIGDTNGGQMELFSDVQ